MVLPLFFTNAPENTMKNTIDDADHIIDYIYLIIIFQLVTNLCHSHSIINKHFLSFIFNSLFF
tara:strand:- start:148 stop:336 length:189 start_codon:yes stop_codon:yes gene_type:complete